jgi:hypothetical protein
MKNRGSPEVRVAAAQNEKELAAAAGRANLRVDVAKQNVRLAKEELKRARKRHKEAKREAKRARKRAEAARKAWKQARRKHARPVAKPPAKPAPPQGKKVRRPRR